MNGIYKKYLHEAMGWMFFRNELMKKLSLKSGFYEFYSDILSLNNDSTMAFQEANKIYKDLFGSFRFESYADFYKSYSVENTKNCISSAKKLPTTSFQRKRIRYMGIFLATCAALLPYCGCYST
jgi:hypothetical protein